MPFIAEECAVLDDYCASAGVESVLLVEFVAVGCADILNIAYPTPIPAARAATIRTIAIIGSKLMYANLSLTPLTKPVSEITELLRSKTQTDYSAHLIKIIFYKIKEKVFLKK